MATSRILVKNIPKHLTEARFKEYFAKIGEVTDVRISRTKDGRSRQFGFIGYKTPEEARRATEYFDRTFVDTSRVSVELAKPIGDASLGRPWSRYSRGSSTYAKAHPNEQPSQKPNPKQEKPTTPEEEAEELERFLSAMNVKHVKHKRQTPDADETQQEEEQKQKQQVDDKEDEAPTATTKKKNTHAFHLNNGPWPR